MPYTLFASKQCGSAAIEALLTWVGADWRHDDLAFEPAALKSDRYRAINPLGQVPTLLLPGGTPITESAAIILTLADHFPDAGLAPPPGSAARSVFYRWLIFLAVNVYGETIHGDFPERYVGDPEQHAAYRERSDAVTRSHWLRLEAAVRPAPFVLGSAMTALDPYVAMIRRWRPGPGWFAAACPKLEDAARAAEAHPAVRAAWERQGWGHPVADDDSRPDG